VVLVEGGGKMRFFCTPTVAVFVAVVGGGEGLDARKGPREETGSIVECGG